MAAQDPFTIVPDIVITLEPVYNNIESQTESQKKEYFNVVATPTTRFRLEFGARTSAERDVILGHFDDQLGSHYSFSWQSVPDYIDSGSNITGRWVAGSLQMPSNSNYWKISILFEKEN